MSWCVSGLHSNPKHTLWCSGTALGHQWTVRHTGPYGGTLSVGSWSTPGTGCCCSVETWQWGSGPGSKGTAAQDSVEIKRVKESRNQLQRVMESTCNCWYLNVLLLFPRGYQKEGFYTESFEPATNTLNKKIAI